MTLSSSCLNVLCQYTATFITCMKANALAGGEATEKLSGIRTVAAFGLEQVRPTLVATHSNDTLIEAATSLP